MTDREVAGKSLLEVIASATQNDLMNIPCSATADDLRIGKEAGYQEPTDTLEGRDLVVS